MDIKQEGKELYKETRNIIKRAIFEKQLVLFVGAGASIDSGLPLWSEAINKIAETMSLGDIYIWIT